MKIRVANAGGRAGDEVAELYLRREVSSAADGRKLAAYPRVRLEAGASIDVALTLRAHDFVVVDPGNRRVLTPGKLRALGRTVSTHGIHGGFTLQ